jgi:Ni/Co efflux regulator RcnB
MKSTAIVCAIAAATMGLSSLSFAQGQDRRGPGTDQRFEQRGDRQEARRDAQEARRDIREGRRDLREARNDRRDARNDRHYNARSAEFHRGRHIPREYRSNQYVVNDWRGHRLSAPPRGHQWVQVGSDYVLIAVATGVIVNLLLNQ